MTSKRSYHFTLRTHTPYMPQVAFYYPEDVKLAESQRQLALRQATKQVAEQPEPKPVRSWAETGCA